MDAPPSKFVTRWPKIAAARRADVARWARSEGLLDGPRVRIGARVPEALLAEAKRRANVTSVTELLEYALGRVAQEDDWGALTAEEEHGLPADVDLEF